ncbi:MAG: hypothetical protein A2506_00795 [Elusimicrobia bacterium RIFOXYD12_FULL_66_9]|nr:MAG: hypothetical protein A2506_00795 [Elusimicrobia bacterium RIFOXYD12_FULL_66_9]
MDAPKRRDIQRAQDTPSALRAGEESMSPSSGLRGRSGSPSKTDMTVPAARRGPKEARTRVPGATVIPSGTR